MRKIKKENVAVDYRKQGEEKNIWFGDYPMKNIMTGRKLRKTFEFYFSSFEEYIMIHEKECKRLGFRYEF